MVMRFNKPRVASEPEEFIVLRKEETKNQNGFLVSFRSKLTGRSEFSRLFLPKEDEDSLTPGQTVMLYRYSMDIIPVVVERNGVRRTVRSVSGLAWHSGDCAGAAARSAAYYYDNCVGVVRSDATVAAAAEGGWFGRILTPDEFASEVEAFQRTLE